MTTDWKKLAIQLGSLSDDGSEHGGDNYAQMAFDEILGDDWIESTVEHIIAFRKGRELAMNCLRYFNSTKATEYAYQVYKSSTGERADQAVWLIKHLANPISIDWVAEFLEDTSTIHWGIGILDQLLWAEQIPYDDKAKSLLELAEKKSNVTVNEQIALIRSYLQERELP